MTDRYRCCRLCKGRAPYPEICRTKECTCHEAHKNWRGDELPTHLGYADPTPNRALNNMRRKK